MTHRHVRNLVAVTGLPDPQEEHAMIMCRFARDCRIKFKEVTQRLELSLGPDTYDLAMRFGIHSGTFSFFNSIAAFMLQPLLTLSF